ncbi:hypothetical protein MVEN_00002500 [Mycena venus]|uniref:Uncharacterized protein n=1 Tax=Mycena venus TaxID=2733690 RepID=A0A8H6Z6H1_9AGAR|nr:hypothetical protein MVEN_00002500 [Mycena venus]
MSDRPRSAKRSTNFAPMSKTRFKRAFFAPFHHVSTIENALKAHEAREEEKLRRAEEEKLQRPKRSSAVIVSTGWKTPSPRHAVIVACRTI